MVSNESMMINDRIKKIKDLCGRDQVIEAYYEAALLAETVLYDTTGGNHPLMAAIQSALEAGEWTRAVAASRAVVTLYEQGGLTSPRLAIAHEIEGDLLDIAQSQLQAAEMNQVAQHKQLQLAIAAFLAGACLEDALRRFCIAQNISFDAQRTSISKLQVALFQPSKQMEVISSSENKQITVWGDARNKADHGNFGDITYAEVLSMVVGVRAFIDRHLP